MEASHWQTDKNLTKITVLDFLRAFAQTDLEGMQNFRRRAIW